MFRFKGVLEGFFAPVVLLLGGSWVVRSSKSGYKSPNMGYIAIVHLLITPLVTTHEPPSKGCLKVSLFRLCYDSTYT